MPPAPVALVETTRRLTGDGERVESRHHGHLVVVGPDGTTVEHLGDPDRVTFVRSAAKPFQAAAAEQLAGRTLPDDLLAVGWSSHRGEPEHQDAVARLLARAGRGPDELTTPAARPAADPAAAATRLAHNCSGKHALFALAGAAIGCPRDRLLDPDGPLQRRVLATLADALEAGPDPPVALDGCGAPAIAAPLVGLARAYRRLAVPEQRWATVVAAGSAHPHLVGGTGRLETALLAAGVVAKPGAEGVFGAGWTDARGAWGVALKVEDGAGRGAAVALAGLLVAAGVVTDGDLAGWDRPRVLGGGAPAGRVAPAADVGSVGRRLRPRA